MAFLDTVKNLLSKNADKVEVAIDKVGDAVDKKTGNKYRGAVDKAQVAAKKAVAGQPAPTEAPTPPPAQPKPEPQQPPAAPPIS